MVAFLLSDESSFCFGSEIVLDGGYAQPRSATPNIDPATESKISLLFPK